MLPLPRLRPCILCGQAATSSVIFFPDRPAEFGLGAPPPGKRRGYVVGLCDDHEWERPAVRLMIEEEIDRQACQVSPEQIVWSKAQL